MQKYLWSSWVIMLKLDLLSVSDFMLIAGVTGIGELDADRQRDQ